MTFQSSAIRDILRSLRLAQSLREIRQFGAVSTERLSQALKILKISDISRLSFVQTIAYFIRFKSTDQYNFGLSVVNPGRGDRCVSDHLVIDHSSPEYHNHS